MNPYQPPGSIREIEAPVLSDQERRRVRSNRWTAIFAIVSGLFMLVAGLVGVYNVETLTKTASEIPEVQRLIDESNARYRVIFLRAAALYVAMSVAGVFLWRRNRWAPHMLTIVCVLMVAKAFPTKMPSKEIVIFNVILWVWLGYILYRAWRMHLAGRVPG